MKIKRINIFSLEENHETKPVYFALACDPGGHVTVSIGSMMATFGSRLLEATAFLTTLSLSREMACLVISAQVPAVVGTMIVVVTALLVAIPLGLLSAIYLSEYAPNAVRKTIKPVLEILEGIPTVATGLFAFFWLRPFLEYMTPWLPWGGLFSTGVAGIAVGLIIVPLIASVADDAMRSVPRALREGAYALGASRLRVALQVVVPAAFSGIIAAFVLGASRAVGETMIVLLVAGAGSPTLNFNPFEGVQTMTAYIASRATGEIAVGSLVYDTIFAVGAA